MPITIHSTDVYWPVINIINSDPQYKRMLVAHMRTIVNEIIANNSYVTKAQQFQALIDTSVLSDNFKFYSYSQFQNGLTGNVSVGSYSVPGISNLLSARLTYLQGTPDFGYTTPVISGISISTPTPALNSTVTISANVVNTNTVYLGYRDDLTKKFTRVIMYDDGAHNDGGSGDNVYGADLIVSSTQVQYYIYAENNNAGMFSPERAEHEYYSIQTNIAQPNAGQIVINEFLAINLVDQTDESGTHEDWIELYNTSNTSLDLSGLYLSDSYSNPQKFVFPNNTIIPANGFLTVWADEDGTAGPSIHCNFKLADSGEQLILSKMSSVLDSVSYGPQVADISYGRCPDGTGSFQQLTSPSYNASNCTVGVKEFVQTAGNISLFPNPAYEHVTLVSTVSSPLTYEVINTIGDVMMNGTLIQKTEINTSTLSQGIYFVKVSDKVLKLVVSH